MANKKSLRVLISVFDKTGLSEFIHHLSQIFLLEIVSTGGTATHLAQAGFPVTPVETITQFPEILSGRVKTLHPKIFGAILADQNNPQHQKEVKHHFIKAFDMVVVNLYPFAATVKRKGVTLKQALEQIDIGGVSLLRAASKNYPAVIVISTPAAYPQLISKLQAKPQLSLTQRRQLAQQAFKLTSSYDRAISQYLAS